MVRACLGGVGRGPGQASGPCWASLGSHLGGGLASRRRGQRPAWGSHPLSPPLPLSLHTRLPEAAILSTPFPPDAIAPWRRPPGGALGPDAGRRPAGMRRLYLTPSLGALHQANAEAAGKWLQAWEAQGSLAAGPWPWRARAWSAFRSPCWLHCCLRRCCVGTAPPGWREDGAPGQEDEGSRMAAR